MTGTAVICSTCADDVENAAKAAYGGLRRDLAIGGCVRHGTREAGRAAAQHGAEAVDAARRCVAGGEATGDAFSPGAGEAGQGARKKPGRKGGHEQARRALPVAVDDEYEVAHEEHCSCCSGHVETVDSYTQTQQDIVTTVHTRRFTVYVGECVDCGQRVEGRHPFQTSTARGNADVQVGPRALALAAQLHYGEGVPFDKVRAHLVDLGIAVHRSTLVRAMNRIALRGMATYRDLLARVLQQDVLHIDETGRSVDGEPCWL